MSQRNTLQIDVIGELEYSQAIIECILYYNGVGYKIAMVKNNYQALIKQGLFVRDGLNKDSADVINTTNLFIEKTINMSTTTISNERLDEFLRTEIQFIEIIESVILYLIELYKGVYKKISVNDYVDLEKFVIYKLENFKLEDAVIQFKVHQHNLFIVLILLNGRYKKTIIIV